MADIEPIDISGVPLLECLVEEARRARQPIELRKGDIVVARLMPVEQPAERSIKERTAEGHDAFLKSAGSWSDVDADAFVEAVYESRRITTRPAVDL